TTYTYTFDLTFDFCPLPFDLRFRPTPHSAADLVEHIREPNARFHEPSLDELDVIGEIGLRHEHRLDAGNAVASDGGVMGDREHVVDGRLRLRVGFAPPIGG